jgi:hypothetical protein
MYQYVLFIFLLLISPLTEGKEPGSNAQGDAEIYTQTLKKLTDIMVLDITGPCAVARYYAYANLLAYEIIFQQEKPSNYGGLYGKLNDYPDFAPIQPESDIDVNFAALYGMLRMGEELLPSGYLLEVAQFDLIKKSVGKNKTRAKKIEATRNYVNQMVDVMLAYAIRDGYVKTSGYLRYTPLNQPGTWQPTPPGYMEAYEPHWSKVRPFLMDSAGQFKPKPPVEFNEEETSPFYLMAKEVYDTTQHLSPEQKAVAGFWDCNPFFLIQKGHLSFGTKKISPGGHWMGITGIASVQKGLSLQETARWHTLVSLTMADAFISCWNEKFQSNRIRPETFINQAMNREWVPLLQTPPFPEYTSGHSVVSASVSKVLTKLAGSEFEYVDTVEEEFGLPSRSFDSFEEAAKEAAISRFYGGIHFRDAIENGFEQGEQIGEYFISRLDF